MQTIAKLAALSIWGAPAGMAVLAHYGLVAPEVAGPFAFISLLAGGSIALIAMAEAELEPSARLT